VQSADTTSAYKKVNRDIRST